MRMLLVSQYFHPEPGAPANRVLSIVRGLANAGHDVTVVCEFPNYPSGNLLPEDRLRLFRKEGLENFQVVRTFVIATTRSGVFLRLVNYWSFMFSSFVVGLFLRRPDLIFVSSPPLFAGTSAAFLSFLKRVPLVADIRDLWPEDAVLMGQLNSRFAIWGGRLTARHIYNRSSLLITISNGLKSRLQAFVGDKPVHVIFNGSSVPDFYPQFHANRIERRDSPFTICYAGVLGLGQPIEDIINVAESTLGDDNIKYMVVGDGVRKKFLAGLAIGKKLSNLVFTGGVSFEESLQLLTRAHVAVVSLIENEIFKSAIPSKFFDCMALGLPVILGVDGEARAIMEKYETGLYYRPGDWRDLKEKMMYMKNNRERAKAFGDNGRMLVCEKFRRSLLTSQLEELLRSNFEKNKKS